MERESIQIKETDIKEFLRPIFSHKLGFFVIFSISVLLSVLYILTTPPIYQTDATLEVREAQQVPTKDIILSAISGGSVVNLDTEMDLLKSRYMVGKALDNINYKISYYKFDGFKNVELYKNSPFRVEILVEKDRSLYGKLVKLDNINGDSFEISYGGTVLASFGINENYEYKKVHRFGEVIDLGSVVVKIEKNGNGNIENGKYFFKINSKESLIGDAIRRLQVYKTSKDSYLVKVVYQDTVPERAKEFVDSLTREYIRHTVRNKTSAAEQKLKFINQQLAIINQNLRDSEVKLENFKRENRLMDLSTEITTTINKLSQFDTKLAELEIKEKLINELYSTVVENNLIDGVSPEAYGINDPVLVSLLDRLNKAIEEKRALLSEYTELHPDVQKVNQKIESIKGSIKAAIVSLKNEIKNQRDAVKSIIERYDSLLRQLPQSEREFVNLKRRYIVNEKIYSYLLEKKVEASIAKAATVSNNRIIDEAFLPSAPVKPKKPIILAIGVLLGLMLGSFYGYVREFLDDTVKTKADIERLTSIPVLGLVPKVRRRKLKGQLLSFKEPDSPFAEAMRAIRGNIQFMSFEKPNKTIMVTSTVGNEGKTTITTNLGAVLSFADKRVIIVDLDMRKPKIHEFFGIVNSEGITDVFLKRKELKEVIKKTPIKDLYIIPVGKLPPNPGDLLISSKLKDIIKQLEEEFDYVVLDSPPIGVVSDTIFLMREVDVSLIVLRSGYSKRLFVRNLDKMTKDYNIKNVGIILNEVKSKDLYYGYGYG